jgi:hypothetical protein
VCADSDGQHSAADVLRVARCVRDGVDRVLGVRGFTGLGLGLLPAKLLTEVLLVTASYQVQRRTVFTRRARQQGIEAGDGRQEVSPARFR